MIRVIFKMAASVRRLHACRRSLIFNQKRCNSVVAAQALPAINNETNSLYPAIKPKYPPGQWGGMEPSYAWLWHKSCEESLAIPTVQERIAALCDKEMNQLIFVAKSKLPRTLEFTKYVTKTHVIQGLPEIYSTALDSALLDNLTAKLSPLICDLIAMEIELLQRDRYLKKFPKASDRHSHEMANLLVRDILSNLSAQLSGQFPHLIMTQYDEQVNLAATWDRHGIQRTRTRMVHPTRIAYDTVDDQCVAAQTSVEFALRSDKPLPEFVNRDDIANMGAEVPELKFTPWVFGQHVKVKGKRSVEAGHVWGDPCEFGLLSACNTVWTRHLAMKYGPNHAQEARLGQGIGASFVWLAAQAHNQGFNTLVDVSYPLSTQTALTDGQHWQFLAYQLNTLQLWKDDQANPLANLCWVGEQVKLFEEVTEGKVRGFNPDVLRQLIACLALAPADRPYSLRPTLPPATDDDPKLKSDYIPVKKEEVIVIEEEKYVVE